MKPWSLMLIVAVWGCGLKLAPPRLSPSARSPAKVNAPFDTAWKLVTTGLDVPIERVNRDSGLVVTAWTTAADRSGDYADCGQYTGMGEGLQIAPTSVRYIVVVQGDSSASTVSAAAQYRTIPQHKRSRGQYDCVSTGRWETDFESVIQYRARSRGH